MMPGLISELLASTVDLPLSLHFFDFWISNAFAESNQSPCPAATFWRHEGDKCQAYEERVREVEW